MLRITACIVLSLAVVVPNAAAENSNIVNGERTSTCEFPTAVALFSGGGLCTGTLVHPEIVLYAAHCGSNFSEVYFAEGLSGQSQSVATAHCKTFTTAQQVGPTDYAYCKLAEPVTQIPITPVLFGCEVDSYIKTGQPATIAGFGDTGSGGAGTKRWAHTSIAGVQGGMVAVGGGGTGAWQGDSGGPAYLQLADGSWRAFGIVSGGSSAGQSVYYVRMETVVSWVEESSGVDITPCHDRNGAWKPTEQCGGFATNLRAGGTWNNWCADNDPLSDPSETCGNSYIPDEKAPTVAITSPGDGDLFELAPMDIMIDVAVEDESRIVRVWLEVDGHALASVSEEPFAFGGQFPKGEYELAAFAEDSRGNVGASKPIVMFVGVEPETEGGCACRTGDTGSPLGALLLTCVGALVVVRRKRGFAG